MEEQHASYCPVWDWSFGERTFNNANQCTCGLRAQQAARAANVRYLLPLGMSDDDFLRTLRIAPIGTLEDR